MNKFYFKSFDLNTIDKPTDQSNSNFVFTYFLNKQCLTTATRRAPSALILSNLTRSTFIALTPDPAVADLQPDQLGQGGEGGSADPLNTVSGKILKSKGRFLSLPLGDVPPRGEVGPYLGVKIPFATLFFYREECVHPWG
jgi:hypothetical protein